jgi:signal transduction histidine kinase
LKKRIITYWLLLIVPTVIIAAVAFRLLQHEQERINQQALVSTRKSVQVIGDTLQGTVQAVEDELTAALIALDQQDIGNTLSRWEVTNPLIRNTFILDPARGLLKPRPDDTVTGEEAQFINRYNALFTGRVPWQTSALDSANQNRKKETVSFPGSIASESDNRSSRVPSDKVASRQQSARRALLDLAKAVSEQSQSAPAELEAAQPGTSGWISWFADNNLFLLGWVKRQPHGYYYGVELEIMTLLSRLILDFPQPESLPEGIVYGLTDGAGNMLHQVGDAMVSGLRPDIEISLSPQLPHWQIVVFLTEISGGGQPSNGFFILSVLVLAIFVIAIFVGGLLFTRQSLQNFKDARQKTNFVSNVSHELKTPLTSIRMYAELLSANRIKSDLKKKQYLQVITDESQRLTRLVNNILDFSRLEQKRKQYRFENLDMRRILTEILGVQKLRLHQSGMTLEKQIPASPVMANTDRDAVEQVLLNLIDNAVKYASEGAIMAVSLEEHDGYCRIKIKDRGPGVSKSHQNKIFDKFYRVDDSLTAKQPGSGLGLSISRRLLRDLNGDLYYESRANGGSRFVVLIPLAQTDPNIV